MTPSANETATFLTLPVMIGVALLFALFIKSASRAVSALLLGFTLLVVGIGSLSSAQGASLLLFLPWIFVAVCAFALALPSVEEEIGTTPPVEVQKKLAPIPTSSEVAEARRALERLGYEVTEKDGGRWQVSQTGSKLTYHQSSSYEFVRFSKAHTNSRT